MLFLIMVFIGAILLYFCIPTPQVKKSVNEPQLIVRNTNKIFTQVDTSAYGRVEIENKVSYEESNITTEEQKALHDIFG